MDPMTLAALAGAGINIGTGVAGAIRGSQKSTIRGLEQSREIMRNLETPDEARLRYQVELLRDMGQLTPEMEEAILQEASAMETIQASPELRSAQMEALARLQQQSLQGLDLNEMAAIQDIGRQQAQASRADQEAIMQNMAARGQLGSGGELAAKLSASQAAADQAAKQGSELARLMASRKLEAAQLAGREAGSMREQEFGEKSKVAQARDLINEFNARSRQGVQERNVGSKNVANRYNLDYSKAREEQRAGAVTEQGKINADAYATALDARNRKAMNVADYNEMIGKSKDKQFADRLAGIQKIGTSIGGMGGSGGFGGFGGAK